MAITTMWLGSCTAVLAVVIAFFQLVTPYTNPPFDPPTDVGRIAGPSELRDRHLHIDRIITIEGRALDIADDTWNKLVGNGCRLLGLMSSTDADGAVYVAKQGSAESDFKESKELPDWGYVKEDDATMDFQQRKNGPHIDDALKALGIDPTPRAKAGPNLPIGFLHAAETIHNGVKYSPTGAQFYSVINVDDGLLVGWYKYGPRYSGRRQHPPVTTLPALQFWANIAFLKWQYVAQTSLASVSNLKYILSAPVANTESYGVMGRALGLKGNFDDDEHCDGMLWGHKREFGMDGDAGKALLASPNGRGAALLLGTHKAAFGEKKTIEKVTVWCVKVKGAYELNWMFHVV